MAIPHAYPGMPVDLSAVEESYAESQTTALVKNDVFEAIRVVLPKGREICHEHEVDGPITVQCLKGRVSLVTDGTTHDLAAGAWTFLMDHSPHTIRGVEDSVVLLTVIFP